jgi:hypothetical protein
MVLHTLSPLAFPIAEFVGHRPATPFVVTAARQRTVKARREKVTALVVVFMFFLPFQRKGRKEILHLKPIIEHMFHNVKGILSLFKSWGTC